MTAEVERDPLPWQRALAALPTWCTVTSFTWWNTTIRPIIQLCVSGFEVTMQPAWSRIRESDGYLVFRGHEWDEGAPVLRDQAQRVVFISDHGDPGAIVARFLVAALVVTAAGRA